MRINRSVLRSDRNCDTAHFAIGVGIFSASVNPGITRCIEPVEFQAFVLFRILNSGAAKILDDERDKVAVFAAIYGMFVFKRRKHAVRRKAFDGKRSGY